MAIVSNWRLKLLALVLSLGLLGAVAFSENPLTLATRETRVSYEASNLTSGLVLINPPPKVNVPVAGLKDSINNLGPNSILVAPNLAGLKTGTTTVNVRPRILTPGVSSQFDTIQIPLTVEERKSRALDVEIRANPAPGVSVDQSKSHAVCGETPGEACKVTVTGPGTFVDGLRAFITYEAPIQTDTMINSSNFLVRFEQANGRPVDFSKLNFFPLPTVDRTSVSLHLEARGGEQQRQIGLKATLSGTPACGYQINFMDIQPTAFPTVRGPVDKLSKVTVLDLGTISVAGATGSLARAFNIPLPDGVSAVDPANGRVNVVVNISQAFNCAAPTPTPVPVPPR